MRSLSIFLNTTVRRINHATGRESTPKINSPEMATIHTEVKMKKLATLTVISWPVVPALTPETVGPVVRLPNAELALPAERVPDAEF
jgi:hypothetical protein